MVVAMVVMVMMVVSFSFRGVVGVVGLRARLRPPVCVRSVMSFRCTRCGVWPGRHRWCADGCDHGQGQGRTDHATKHERPPKRMEGSTESGQMATRPSRLIEQPGPRGRRDVRCSTTLPGRTGRVPDRHPRFESPQCVAVHTALAPGEKRLDESAGSNLPNE